MLIIYLCSCVEETLCQTVSEWIWQNSLWEKVRFLKNLVYGKNTMLHVLVAVAEHEDFVIQYIAISDLSLVKMGGKDFPFFHSFLFLEHTLQIFRGGWRLHYSSGRQTAANEFANHCTMGVDGESQF